MRDNIDNPLLFQKYFSDFYSRIFNYWYWLIAHSHSEPVYVAVEEIQKRDVEYFNLVTKLIDVNKGDSDTVLIAESIVDRLFTDNKN